MTRGFYQLSSGMITENRALAVAANNIANVRTVGFKKDMLLSTTFEDFMMNRADPSYTALGDVSFMKTVDETVTIHTQGTFEQTQRTLDVGLIDSGFFAIVSEEGADPVYTRNGSFNLDEEGYLYLLNHGRVQGDEGDIYLGTDDISISETGTITTTDGEYLGQLAVYDFEDYSNLRTVGEGMYYAEEPFAKEVISLMWQSVEMSNVDLADEMTNIIAIQRVMQNVSQALTMYDTALQKTVTEIARV